ncbi:hypothetical protein AB0280_17600 [Pseudarthrobacter sp902506025]|uniref:hypothetical protein n=1 Tax=Pseudarthrobacter sp. 902506025 TaxID=3155291 RepID=UPI00344B7782
MVKKAFGSAIRSAKSKVRRPSAVGNRRKINDLTDQWYDAKKAKDKDLVAHLERQIRRLGGRVPSSPKKKQPRELRKVLKDAILPRVAVAEPEMYESVQRVTRPKPAPVPDMTVSVFLDTDDAVTALKVIKATQRMANELGYETPTITDVQRGSLWTWMVAKWNSAEGQKIVAASKAKGKEIIEEAEHLGKLQIQKQQAEVDASNVSSAVELMTAYADVSRVAIKIGALLFVKYPAPDGSSVVITRTLSTKEMIAYDKTPSICSKPELLEQNLALLVAEGDQKTISQ